LRQLRDVPGVRILGPEVAQDRGGAISFTMDVAHPHDIAQVLDQQGIAVRAGHHCAEPLHRRFGISASARASLHLYNTAEDIDALVEGLGTVRRFFTRTPHPIADRR
jgi:cysteine desulfurase/selenocysteine lyase